VDGYLLSDRIQSAGSLAEHIRAFANTCREEGYEKGLRSIVAGTFNLVVVDLAALRCYVTNDYTGSLSLYYSKLKDGWLISSNPVALASTGLIDTQLDMIGCAEWAYIGHTVGERYFLKGIKIIPPFTTFRWEAAGGRGQLEKNPDSPWDILPTASPPSVDELADSFGEACQRISTIDPRPAHLQSAGKDSRLILASWPEGYNPPCYTYGNPESHEVRIARSIADIRGSEWIHVWLDGDEAASSIEAMFHANGLIIWPDRYLVARQMQRDGYSGVLDGFCGGFLTHMTHGFGSDQYFSRLSRIGRYLTVFIDQKVSSVGLDRISEALYQENLEVHHDDELRSFISAEFVAQLSRQKLDIMQDIHSQVRHYVPANDSVAILWRNFMTANRGTHAIAQQGVLCRCFVNVYCPFSGDRRYHWLQMETKPEAAAYDRLTGELYRRRFPKYGDLPNSDSLLPLRSSPFRHGLSSKIMSKGWSIPFVTGNTRGQERDANSWIIWLRHNQRLRETAAGFLREGGILDEQRCAAAFEAISSGTKRGSGKLFHLASIAKWISLSGNTPVET
jgi:asparagine synthetase B (glutamine-hydrolysing)